MAPEGLQANASLSGWSFSDLIRNGSSQSHSQGQLPNQTRGTKLPPSPRLLSLLRSRDSYRTGVTQMDSSGHSSRLFLWPAHRSPPIPSSPSVGTDSSFPHSSWHHSLLICSLFHGLSFFPATRPALRTQSVTLRCTLVPSTESVMWSLACGQ